jgi:hypothetical protein
LRVDAVQLAGLHERRDATPVLRPLVVTGEECILAIKRNRTDAPLDSVGVELDATVIKKARKPVPMITAIADSFSNLGLR